LAVPINKITIQRDSRILNRMDRLKLGRKLTILQKNWGGVFPFKFDLNLILLKIFLKSKTDVFGVTCISCTNPSKQVCINNLSQQAVIVS
jgi:hypothetical protein